MKKKVVLLGAGGKMGNRVTSNLKEESSYDISYIEISETGRKNLKDRFGVEATSSYDSLKECDMVVFAVPDILIKKVSADVIPMLKSGATVIGLDPAAHYGKVMLAYVTGDRKAEGNLPLWSIADNIAITSLTGSQHKKGSRP